MARIGSAAAVAVTTAAAFAAGPVAAAPQARSAAPAGSVVQGELIVAYEPGASRSDRLAARRGHGARFGRRMLLPRTELVRIDPDESERAVARRMERDPRVKYAEPNRIRTASADVLPNDTHFGQLWGLHNLGQAVNGTSGTADADIDAPEAWHVTPGSPDVTVAIVDTGIALTHPDLQPNLWTDIGEVPGNNTDDDFNGFIDDVNGWDFADNDADPTDTDGHGTHVAGTAAARGGNNLGITGVSQQSRIMPLKVFDAAGSATDANVADAFTYAGRNGARVANASLGGPGFSSAMSEAIDRSPNTLFVVAAGNDGHNNDSLVDAPQGDYPCNFTHANLVCVAATDQADAFATFTNHGATSVDLAAPGVSTLSTYPFVSAFSEGFEGTDQEFSSRWTLAGGWGRTTANFPPAGTHSLTDSPGGPYASNLSSANNSAGITAPVDLTGRQSCRLEFLSSINVPEAIPGDTDALHLEASTDGTNWNLVKSYRFNDLGQWFVTDADLSAYDGQQQVRLRFAMQSDAANEGDGAYIDQLKVICRGAGYAFLNGTSMASPHVAGAAALVFAANPGASVSFVRQALLSTVDPLPSATDRSRLVTGGRLNAARAVAFVAPEPEPEPDPPPPDQTQTNTQQPAPAPAPPPPPPPPTQPPPTQPPPGDADTTFARDLADAALGFPRRLFRVSAFGRLRGVEAWSSTRSSRVRSGVRSIDPRLALANDDDGPVRVLVRSTLTTSTSPTARSSRSERLGSRRFSIADGRAARVRLRLSRSALKALRSARRGRLVMDITVIDSSGRSTRARKAYQLYPPRRF